MTIEKLLEQLKNQREAVNHAISMIEQAQHDEQHSVKRAKIISSIRREKKRKKPYIPVAPKSYNGTHWMQQPKNRAKMFKQLKKMQAGNKRAHKERKARNG